MMLHGLHKWSSMLSVHLWPYGLQMANDICNSTPCKGSDITPIELFSGVTICPKLKHYHSFGCPTYVLDKELQAQKSLPKWRSIARLGIYLGPSPNHSRSVSLVFNPHTGHVTRNFMLNMMNSLRAAPQLRCPSCHLERAERPGINPVQGHGPIHDQTFERVHGRSYKLRRSHESRGHTCESTLVDRGHESD